MKTPPMRQPSATHCLGLSQLRSAVPSSVPSWMSATLAAVIMPAAAAFDRPMYHSDDVRITSIGSAPSPVDSAVTHPYHHTCAAERPP